MMWIGCRGRVVGATLEFLEDLVGAAAEQHGVEKRNIIYCRFRLLRVGHDPSKLPSAAAKYPFAVIRFNVTIRRVDSIMSPLGA